VLFTKPTNFRHFIAAVTSPVNSRNIWAFLNRSRAYAQCLRSHDAFEALGHLVVAARSRESSLLL